jgi:probable rRNA maturation factor
VIAFSFIDVEVSALDMVNVSSWLESVCKEEMKEVGDINYIFCNDEYLLEINRSYLDHDYYTDVITFDYSEGLCLSGDVFVSVDRVIENAKDFNVSFLIELLRVIVHGILHLAGYKDKLKDDKKLMRFKEDYCLLNYVPRETF